MIEPVLVDEIVSCSQCGEPLVAHVGRTVERPNPKVASLWWTCPVCRTVTRAFPFPLRFLSEGVGSLGPVNSYGADGLQPPRMARTSARPMRR